MLSRRGRDDGLSLVELAVASAVTGVLLAAVGPVVLAVLGSFGHVQDASQVHDRGRVILDRLDRDLRQVSEINRPTTSDGRIYLEYLAATGAGTPTCTQWRYDPSAAQLAVRSWAVGSSAAPAWGTAATGMVNTAAEPPFTVTPAGGTAQHQQLTVALRLRLPRDEALTRTVLTARNSSEASPSNADADHDGLSDVPVCTTFGRT